jgi:beta-N-acetylhexosaminidase
VLAGSQADGDGEETGVPSRAARLPLERRVGQLLVSSFEGPRAPAYLRSRLRDGRLAGVILFPGNVASRSGLRGLTRTLQASARGRALVMTDQEGGVLRSIPFAAPAIPQSSQRTTARARRVALGAARDLRAVGVNVNLAPVADLPEGPALRARAFRGDPAAVSRLVRAAVGGYARGGVGATVKHFPGLGAAAVNTDFGPVTITRGRRELERRDLAPFRAAVSAGAPLVMASHALYSAFDERRIASQSRALLTGVLRAELGFEGVVITDSIEADAVLRRSSVAVAAERSVAAGADIVLMTGSASWKLVYPALLARARRSAAFRARVTESADRVIELKRRLGLRPPRGGG